MPGKWDDVITCGYAITYIYIDIDIVMPGHQSVDDTTEVTTKNHV